MVRDLLTQFLDAYLIRRDLRTTMAFLTDDAVVIGMGVSEVAVNKDEIRTKMLRVFERIFKEAVPVLLQSAALLEQEPLRLVEGYAAVEVAEGVVRKVKKG